MTKARCIVIHGTGGNPDGNWFPYLAEQLSESHEVLVPKFPTPDGQTLDNWLEIFEPLLPLRSTDILVGHSMGAGFLLQLLGRIEPEGGMVKATLLVSSFMDLLGDAEFDSLNKSFVTPEPDWDVVQGRAGQVCVWHGDDDPYVDLVHGKTIAEVLKADFRIVPGGKHLNAESGHLQFPELVEFITEIP